MHHKIVINDSLVNAFKTQKSKASTAVKYTHSFNKRQRIVFSYKYKLENYIRNSTIKSTFGLPKAQVSYLFSLHRLGNFSIYVGKQQDVVNVHTFFDGYFVNNYRTLSKYSSKLAVKNTKTIGFLHNYQVLGNAFLMFTAVNYSASDKSIVSQSAITENANYNQFHVLNKPSSFLYVDNQITRYFSKLNTSIKIENKADNFTSYTQANSLNYFKTTNIGYHFKLFGTTYFSIPINFRFAVNYDKFWSFFNNTKTTVATAEYHLNTLYSVTKALKINTTINTYKVQGDFQNLLSSFISYVPSQSRFAYRLTIHNLFNKKAISQSSNYNYLLAKSSTQIIPRYVLASVTFRF